MPRKLLLSFVSVHFHPYPHPHSYSSSSNLIIHALYSPPPASASPPPSCLHPPAGRSDQTSSQDYQHGIFQSIGFKEFHNYLTAPEGISTQKKDELRHQGIEALKIATKRYARSQNKWVHRRFLKRPGDSVPAVYGLDVTDMSKWEETVLNPALQILDRLSKGEEPAIAPIRVEGAKQRNKQSYHICDLCDKIIIGDQEWAVHMKSKIHHHHMRKKRMIDPDSDLPPSTGEPPVSAGTSPSEDCAETSPDSSKDTGTAHSDVPVRL